MEQTSMRPKTRRPRESRLKALRLEALDTTGSARRSRRSLESWVARFLFVRQVGGGKANAHRAAAAYQRVLEALFAFRITEMGFRPSWRRLGRRFRPSAHEFPMNIHTTTTRIRDGPSQGTGGAVGHGWRTGIPVAIARAAPACPE